MLGEIYEFIFLEQDPAKELNVEDNARKHMEELAKIVRANLRAVGGGRLSLAGIFHSIQNVFTGHAARRGSHEFMEKLIATGKPVDELANSILSVLVVATVELSQAMINMVNLYLDDSHAEQRAKIQSADPKDGKILQGYAREAFRIDPPFAGVYREARADKTLGEHDIVDQDRLFLSIQKANLDSTVFPEPLTVNPTRPAELYLSGDGISRSFGNEFVHSVMGAVLSTVFSLKNLRRAPGISGQLKRFRYETNGTEYYQYLDKNMDPVPWATSLILQYDV